MTVREQIVARLQAAGYDVFSACEQADVALRDFKASGKPSMQFGIMGAHGKCVDTFEIRKDG